MRKLTTMFGKNHRQDARSTPQRRAFSRLSFSAPVRVMTTSRLLVGVMEDISLWGARVRVDDPPMPGREVLLKMDGREAFGAVVWARDDLAGIVFDQPISGLMLLEAEDRADDADDMCRPVP
ncbi:PilZ domain-containing protein [Novosphingobium sp.]|uniref:PilZ domain-containing protein n=1 Tax=Novosphingobium sp. TaxID=1874826 RepID=UPI00333E31FE